LVGIDFSSSFLAKLNLNYSVQGPYNLQHAKLIFAKNMSEYEHAETKCCRFSLLRQRKHYLLR